MSMIVKNNVAAVETLGVVQKHTSDLEKSLERIASGQKINSAKDDNSAYAISERMRSQIRGLAQSGQNVQNGSTMFKVAADGIDKIVEELRDLKELAINSANDTNTNSDRLTIQKEFSHKMETINDIALNTKYNGKILLDGTYTIKGVKERLHQDENPADIVFVVDTTGSMGSYINDVANNIKQFTDKLNERDFDWRIGIVRYDEVNDYEGKDTSKDIGVERIKFSKGDFSINADEVEGELKYLAASLGDGGDLAESAYEGIIEAAKFNFRENADKHIFVLTDNEAHTKEGGGLSEYTTRDIIDTLTDKSIKLSAIMNSSNSGTWGTIISATNGRSYDITDNNYGESMDSFARSLDILKQLHNDNPLIIHHDDKANYSTKFYIEDMQTKSLGTGQLIKNDGTFLMQSDKERYVSLGNGSNSDYQTDLQANWLAVVTAAQNKSLDDINVETQHSANVAIRVLDGAIDYALNEATNVGSYLRRLDFIDSNVRTMHDNIQAAESKIRDADLANEMLGYTRSNMLIQSAQTMLSQANQKPSEVLNLLR